jgi:hypothetical protein
MISEQGNKGDKSLISFSLVQSTFPSLLEAIIETFILNFIDFISLLLLNFVANFENPTFKVHFNFIILISFIFYLFELFIG